MYSKQNNIKINNTSHLLRDFQGVCFSYIQSLITVSYIQSISDLLQLSQRQTISEVHSPTENMIQLNIFASYVKRWAIWYHLYNLKNVKNSHGGVLTLVKLQASACNLLKLTLLHGCFSRFLNCTNITKSRNASHILYETASSQNLNGFQ